MRRKFCASFGMERTVVRILRLGRMAGRICLALFLCLVAAFASAQSPTTYEGPDRAQRLLEGARREGALTLYTSMADKDVKALAAAFEKKYGIKVNVWRSGKNKVLQRVVAEARAGRNEVDVVQNPSPEMEALRIEKLLQQVRSPYYKDLIDAALPGHGEWTGLRVYVFVQAYNPQKVSKSELPRNYQDLLDPRWKGRLGIEGKEQEWFYTLVQAMGEEKGLNYFRKLAGTNGFSVHQGNSLLANMIISGEVPLSLTTYSYLVDQAREKGAPIDYVALEPTVAYTDGIGIVRQSPHPHAAMLFYDFMLTDGQTMMSEKHHLTTSKRNEATLSRFHPVYINPSQVLATYEKWSKLFEDTINNRSR
jgi:iron(III) transport system substrate-binding protein